MNHMIIDVMAAALCDVVLLAAALYDVVLLAAAMC